jgi:enoyl-CoA hydratase
MDPHDLQTQPRRIEMSYRCFDVEREGAVAHLRMNRPEALNTLLPEFWTELPEIVQGLDAEGTTRAIVISSTGKHFTAGLDLSVLTSGTVDKDAERGRARANLRLLAMNLQNAFTCLEGARMPVLAAIQGGCVGGGVDFVTACDMRYCTADAWFCIQEINIAITADVGTLQRLPKLIPEGVARELAYTGRRLSAERALEVGLVNQVYADHAAMLKDVMEIAGEIAERSPLAIWGSKEMINYGRDHSVADGLNYIATWQAGMFHNTDTIEAFTAQREKRSAKFDDLLPLDVDL